MWEEIRCKHETMAARYVSSQRHTIQVDWVPFMDEVAQQLGAKPDLCEFLQALVFKQLENNHCQAISNFTQYQISFLLL